MKFASELNVTQAATIAAITKNPQNFDPSVESSEVVSTLLDVAKIPHQVLNAKKQLKDSAPAVLDAAIAALDAVAEGDWKTDFLHETLNKALVEDGGYKPRLAFGPVRVAMSGRRVSPPLFESMEIVGKDVAMARLKGLREHL